jgi:hypothetical protein
MMFFGQVDAHNLQVEDNGRYHEQKIKDVKPEPVKEKYVERFGKQAKLRRSFPDKHLYTPFIGRFQRGRN